MSASVRLRFEGFPHLDTFIDADLRVAAGEVVRVSEEKALALLGNFGAAFVEVDEDDVVVVPEDLSGVVAERDQEIASLRESLAVLSGENKELREQLAELTGRAEQAEGDLSEALGRVATLEAELAEATAAKPKSRSKAGSKAKE